MKQPQIFAYAKRQNVPTWAHGFQMKIRSYSLCFFKCHMALHIDLQYKLSLSRTIAIGLKGNLMEYYHYYILSRFSLCT